MTMYSISKDFDVFIIEEGKKEFKRFKFVWGLTLIYGKYFVFLHLICCQNSDENMLISCEIQIKDFDEEISGDIIVTYCG